MQSRINISRHKYYYVWVYFFSHEFCKYIIQCRTYVLIAQGEHILGCLSIYMPCKLDHNLARQNMDQSISWYNCPRTVIWNGPFPIGVFLGCCCDTVTSGYISNNTHLTSDGYPQTASSDNLWGDISVGQMTVNNHYSSWS